MSSVVTDITVAPSGAGAPPSSERLAPPVTRFESLDWLRGLLALSIMLYHLTLWELVQPDASTTLGRLGVYGVSMFFVLSGLSIAIAYNRFLQGPSSTLRFMVRRVFRIWPLLWITVLSVTAMNLASSKPISLKVIALNLTTLFGFVSPSSYMTTGAWSIGNEMVYYALTPLLLLAYRRSRAWGNGLVLASAGVALVFSQWLLDPAIPLSRQWATYINPFNNLFLYAAGIALYFNAGQARRLLVSALLLIVGLAVFTVYPVGGDTIHIVTGLNRWVFSAASIGIVFAVYGTSLRLPAWVGAPLVHLGLATYGVYLLHPVVWQALHLLAPDLARSWAGWGVLASVSALTVIISLLVYHRIEHPMVLLGKRLTSARSSSDPSRP
ncbi:acyltransferase family protein [Paucibacter sp. M5-1]|uniref:acyltransferase family protein n=1 Tax=Paucibacter sp. M5-1 TaxID=3015998 RepID=UPI0022B8B992|nr:acyltransferase [Paucibacter sp. M5-1]MCZ7879633.1 acyltransferase [Paucibacter sp. M5-1]